MCGGKFAHPLGHFLRQATGYHIARDRDSFLADDELPHHVAEREKRLERDDR